MQQRSIPRIWKTLVTSIFLLQIAACADATAGAGADDADRTIDAASSEDVELARELEAVRDATQKYRDVEVALAEGYVRDPMDMCVTAQMEGLPRQLGSMGIHYFRPDLLGLTTTEPRVAGVGIHGDFRQPGVLVYEPQADGSLELVAVENLIWQAPWRSAGHTDPPEYMGNEYWALANNPTTDVDEAHGFEPHYELHMWLYRENPTGLFAPFNPNVTCEHHTGAAHGH